MRPPTIDWTGAAQPLGGGGRIGAHPRDYWTLMQDSLAAEKLAWFREQDLPGICIWVLDGVEEPPETFALIRKHLLE